MIGSQNLDHDDRALRRDNADRSELSQAVGEVSDRQGGLACVQRLHRYRFCPYGSDLKAPPETVRRFSFGLTRFRATPARRG